MRIPTPVQRGAPVGSITVNPLQPVYKNTTFANNQEFSQNLSSIGDSALNIGRELDNRRVETTMRLAQADFDTVVRDAINPQTGLMSRRGGSARGVADEIDGLMEAAKGRIGLDKMTGNARKAVEKLYTTTKESLYGKMAAYEIGQLDAYDTELSAGRIAGAADRASANPTDDKEYQTSIIQAKDAAEKEAARAGLSPTGESKDAWDQAVLKGTSTVVLATVNALANTSAKAAQELLDAALAAGDIDATSYQVGKGALAPRIIEQNAKTIAQEALDIKTGKGVSDPTTPIMRLIHREESGSGGYKTLYAQGQNSAFAGTDITTMTLRELVAFSEPSGEYGQWVKPRLNPNGYAAKNGLTSTPMGKYQIVGRTLRYLIKKMNLTGDEVFDAAMQDKMFGVLMQGALDGASSQAGKRAGLRSEWEGFYRASNAELDTAIAAFESGGISYTDPMDRINAEPDIETRQQALRMYNAESTASEAAKRAERAAALDDFYASIDGMSEAELRATEWDDVLTQAQREALGTDTASLRSWFYTRKGDTTEATDPLLYNQLLDNASGANGNKIDPETNKTQQQTFMELNLNEHRADLSPADWQELKDLQREMKTASLDKKLPTLQAATPDSSVIATQMGWLGLPTKAEDMNEAQRRMVSNIQLSLGRKGMLIPDFKGWNDVEIKAEIEMQMATSTASDGFWGSGADATDVPLYKVRQMLRDENAMGSDLIAYANASGTGQGLIVGNFVIRAQGVEEALEWYKREYPDFTDVYADDLIDYIYTKLQADPTVLGGVDTLADKVQGEVGDPKRKQANEAKAERDRLLAEQKQQQDILDAAEAAKTKEAANKALADEQLQRILKKQKDGSALTPREKRFLQQNK